MIKLHIGEKTPTRKTNRRHSRYQHQSHVGQTSSSLYIINYAAIWALFLGYSLRVSSEKLFHGSYHILWTHILDKLCKTVVLLNSLNPPCIDLNPFETLPQGSCNCRLHSTCKELLDFLCLFSCGKLRNANEKLVSTKNENREGMRRGNEERKRRTGDTIVLIKRVIK